MIFDGYVHQLPDIDPTETQEWLDSLDAIVETHGKTRARFLLSQLLSRANDNGVSFPATVSTPYVNTIPREQEPWFPGDEHIERRIRAFIRWNAAMMVVKANKAADGIGGHLSTFASSASLYEIGFNHFFKRQGRQARRPCLLPGPRSTRRVRPSVPRGPPDRGRPRPLPARDRPRRHAACRRTRTRA